MHKISLMVEVLLRRSGIYEYISICTQENQYVINGKLTQTSDDIFKYM